MSAEIAILIVSGVIVACTLVIGTLILVTNVKLDHVSKQVKELCDYVKKNLNS